MDPWNPLEALGSALIAGAIAMVGWIMSTFTRRHIESMDKLSDRVTTVATDVAVMRSNLEAMAESNERRDDRISRLEESRL